MDSLEKVDLVIMMTNIDSMTLLHNGEYVSPTVFGTCGMERTYDFAEGMMAMQRYLSNSNKKIKFFTFDEELLDLNEDEYDLFTEVRFEALGNKYFTDEELQMMLDNLEDREDIYNKIKDNIIKFKNEIDY